MAFLGKSCIMEIIINRGAEIMEKRIAVIFPGVGYHVDKPLLYYSRKLAGKYGMRLSVQIMEPCLPALREMKKRCMTPMNRLLPM